MIPDGLMQLQTLVIYRRNGGPPPPQMMLSAALQVMGNNWAIVSSTGGPQLERANFNVNYRGSNLFLNATCGGGGMTGATYTARANGFDMIINDPNGAFMYQFNR